MSGVALQTGVVRLCTKSVGICHCLMFDFELMAPSITDFLSVITRGKKWICAFSSVTIENGDSTSTSGREEKSAMMTTRIASVGPPQSAFSLDLHIHSSYAISFECIYDGETDRQTALPNGVRDWSDSEELLNAIHRAWGAWVSVSLWT